MALLRHVNRCIYAYPKIIIDLDCPIQGLTAEERDCWLMMASLRICDRISLAG